MRCCSLRGSTLTSFNFHWLRLSLCTDGAHDIMFRKKSSFCSFCDCEEDTKPFIIPCLKLAMYDRQDLNGHITRYYCANQRLMNSSFRSVVTGEAEDNCKRTRPNWCENGVSKLLSSSGESSTSPKIMNAPRHYWLKLGYERVALLCSNFSHVLCALDALANADCIDDYGIFDGVASRCFSGANRSNSALNYSGTRRCTNSNFCFSKLNGKTF